MENKLDDFFKNKLDEREVIFNEAHWKQAEFMLDKADDEAERKAWWRYGLLGLLSLIFVSGMVWCFAKGGILNQNKQHKSLTIKEQNIIKNRNNINENRTTETTELTNDKNSGIANDATNANLDINRLEQLEHKNNRQEQANKLSNKEVNNASLTDLNNENKQFQNQEKEAALENAFKNKNTPTTNTTKKNIIFENTIEKANALDQKNNSSEKSAVSEKAIATTTEQIEKNADAEKLIAIANEAGRSNAKSEKISAATNQVKEKKTNTNTKNGLKDNSNLSTEQVVLSENPISVTTDTEKNINALEDTNYLENELSLLDLPNKELGDLVPVIELKKIETAKENSWRLGITTSALVYPSSNSSDATYSDYPDINRTVNAQHFTGFKVGPTVDYSIRRHWGLHAAMLYYQQTGTFQSVRSSRQVQYRFGVESSTVELVPQSLHYLELPLLTVRKWDKHGLEFGLSTNFLIAVKTKYGTYQKMETETETETETLVLTGPTTSWQYKDGFAQMHFRALLGYQYQVSKRWQVGLRMNYTLGNGIVDKEYEAPRRFILLENKPVNFDLKLSYRF